MGLAMEIFHMGAAKKQVNQGSTMMHALGVAMAFVTQFCLIVMLIRFEQVDVLQQLEREVKTLAKQNEAVEGQSVRMREFWSNCQQLTELWLYRTVPRLDLYKEIHSQLCQEPEFPILLNSLEEITASSTGALKAIAQD